MLSIGLLVDTLLRCPSPLTLIEENTLDIKVTRPPAPTLDDLKHKMLPGQWGCGVIKEVDGGYTVVMVLRRTNAFVTLPKDDSQEPCVLSVGYNQLSVTEILPKGTKIEITAP